ncbi:MAG: DUF2721 domain-containing protein [Desulfobacteraceae bacterium]|jgi:hypothetical protein
MTPVNIAGAVINFQTNPFIMLTFIVAPAVLTNCSALMAMSTSNRFARTIDRARELAKQIEEGGNEDTDATNRSLNDIQCRNTFVADYQGDAKFLLVPCILCTGGACLTVDGGYSDIAGNALHVFRPACRL